MKGNLSQVDNRDYCGYFDCWRLGVVSSMMPRTFAAGVFLERES